MQNLLQAIGPGHKAEGFADEAGALQKDLQSIMLYQELSNHTRMRANRGYMPVELFEKEEKRPRVFRLNKTPVRIPVDAQAHGAPSVPPAPKVGRNDPCPCGSGLKYKRCCGKAPSHLN